VDDDHNDENEKVKDSDLLALPTHGAKVYLGAESDRCIF
jgi:hypothetical protein